MCDDEFFRGVCSTEITARELRSVICFDERPVEIRDVNSCVISFILDGFRSRKFIAFRAILEGFW